MKGSRLPGRQRLRRVVLRAIGAAGRGRAVRDVPRDSSALRRLLLLRPDHLGDILWLTPALHGLRARCPEAQITVAIGPWSRAILDGNRDYDRLITLDFPGFTRRPKGTPLAPYQALRVAARELRAQDFDAALILRDDHWWGALLAATAGIPRRFGHDHPDVAPFLTDTIPLRAGEHTGLGNIRLVDALLHAVGRPPLLDGASSPTSAPIDYPLVFEPGQEARDRAAALLAPLGPATHAPIVAIHPSAGVPVKLWDEGRLAAVADQLARAFGARIVLTGVKGDEPLTRAVAAGMATTPPLDLTGQTNVAELVALYARCALVIGPDSGALHLAVAADTPTVHLFGPADPVRFGPWGDPARHRVVTAGRHCDRCGDLSPTRPRGAACMLAIGVDSVLATARELLGQRIAR
jgi:heptosyltransferase-2/heptosyltransferase-3